MDPPRVVARATMPERLAPMLATPGALPKLEEAYAFEIKWDGVRTLLYSSEERFHLSSRNLLDVTCRYLELEGLHRALRGRRVILDGEIVALDAKARPSFERLQARMGLSSPRDVQAAMREVPVVYMIFDLLYLDDRSTMELPYTGRRALLESLELVGPAWQTPAYHAGAGQALLKATRSLELEGIIAKRLDSRYEPGRRTGTWLKIKNQQRQELVIGGWLPGGGARTGRLGALLTGYYDVTPAEAKRRGTPQRLIYAGKVGTGYTEATLEKLGRLLAPLKRDSSPFDAGSPPRGAIFVEPRLVGEFEFTEWTRGNAMRHPSFKGLRGDKTPNEVIREEVIRHAS